MPHQGSHPGPADYRLGNLVLSWRRSMIESCNEIRGLVQRTVDSVVGTGRSQAAADSITFKAL
jgi:hypothetical protein